MEDGPEEADGAYEYSGKTYRLDEADSEVWSVYDGDTYLGVVRVAGPVEGEPGPHYVAKLVGEEHDPDTDVTDDWRSALEWLLDQTSE
jgi:hypothetical protein